jgi:hypothetical protein
MDVNNNQSKAIAQARDRYREAQVDLKGSYDKNLNQMKETYDGKFTKQAKNYDEHKSKLEEQNAINNEIYTDKTKTAINSAQDDFKKKLRENTAKFDQDRTGQKNELNEKLAGLSDSYKKSEDENNRYQDQVKKSMNDRYTTANKRYQDDFTKQISDLDKKSTKINKDNRDHDHQGRISLEEKNSSELEHQRNSADEQKFKEVSRLREGNENLRTTMSRDNQMLKDRQEERVADLFKLKNKEGEDGQANFENLQKDLRMKNMASQEKENTIHKKESKELESRFNEDIRNIQSVANEKIKGGTTADNLNDELKQTKTSYDNRLQSAQNEISRNNSLNSEKENIIDSTYKEKMKQMKLTNIETMNKKEAVANEVLKQNVYENSEKNSSIVDRLKSEASTIKKSDDDHLDKTTEQSKNKIKEQRVEFGRVVNTMNDKNMETINSLKHDYSKDKTNSIEKSKKDFNDEKIAMKNGFNRTVSVRDTVYEQKLAEMEKQTNKIIDNYENRMATITRKTENEIEQIKSTETERKVKEAQANKTSIENLKAQGNAEIVQMRDKYEGKIARDHAVTENNTNKIIQKYEDQLNRERIDHQKELSTRIGESQSQFERLFKSSELEKKTLRNQYEQRIENMKLGDLTDKDSSKKA